MVNEVNIIEFIYNLDIFFSFICMHCLSGSNYIKYLRNVLKKKNVLEVFKIGNIKLKKM